MTGTDLSVEIEPVRIAVVMPSTITDLAWSESIYDSLKFDFRQPMVKMSLRSPILKICLMSLMPPRLFAIMRMRL